MNKEFWKSFFDFKGPRWWEYCLGLFLFLGIVFIGYEIKFIVEALGGK